MKKFILPLLIASSIISSCTPISLNKKESAADVVDQQPLPPKGMDEFMRYIGDNFHYSEEMINNQITGLVEISFVVEKDGSIADVKVTKDLGFGTGEEGIRLIKEYGNWTPGYQKGKPVRVAYTLPIRLNLMDTSEA